MCRKVYVKDSYERVYICDFIRDNFTECEVVDNIDDADILLVSAKLILDREIFMPRPMQRVIVMSVSDTYLAEVSSLYEINGTFDKCSLNLSKESSVSLLKETLLG